MRAVTACALAVCLLAGVLLVACRVVLVVVLRFLQPVLAGPFVVGCIGGAGATIGFAADADVERRSASGCCDTGERSGSRCVFGHCHRTWGGADARCLSTDASGQGC